MSPLALVLGLLVALISKAYVFVQMVLGLLDVAASLSPDLPPFWLPSYAYRLSRHHFYVFSFLILLVSRCLTA